MAETDTPVQTGNGQENVSALEKDIIRQVEQRYQQFY